MPLTITIPGKELYDSAANRFVITKDHTITLEHSLLSIARWESKWHKPFISREEKTRDELIDYIRCMTLTQNVNPSVYYGIDNKTLKIILDYMQDPNTATTIKQQQKRGNQKVITNEVIYYWMTALNIPFDPCEKWHFGHLMTLIEVCNVEQQPKKKMSRSESAARRASLNAARRAKYNTKG